MELVKKSWKTNPRSDMFNLKCSLTTIVLVKLATGDLKNLTLVKWSFFPFLFFSFFLFNKLVSVCPSSLWSFARMTKGYPGVADRPCRYQIWHFILNPTSTICLSWDETPLELSGRCFPHVGMPLAW